MQYAVVMAGGTGTRFWPASRAACPKQLLDLGTGRTMIQATIDRLGDLVSPDRILIVTNAQLVDPIAAQFPHLPAGAILGEPCKRDTAPCIGLAAAWVCQRDPEGIMLTMPADHVIRPDDVFQQSLAHAVRLVESDPSRLITFGIRPTYAAEIFGYIERGEEIADAHEPARPVYAVRKFHEKPNASLARAYLESGNCYWNSGIFVWRAQTILDELDRHEPEMSAHLQVIARSLSAPSFPQVLAEEFPRIQGKSIDYAVMERSRKVYVIEAPFAWDDVGNWQSLSRLAGSDAHGNTIQGKHVGVDTSGCIVRGSDNHLIVTVGLTDTIVVHTPDATLVANKHCEESLRAVVKILQDRGWTEYL